ncbi:hypothetical protein DPMN_144385 [Dreissena polymorpha]|uniref:B box-type domain-containing protein n=1 Tax=Dreissena polymorpha TaxID=45954 RepID=A0A9D4GEJ0_DREPO|nr:hypothetical protein DPMN_144385 [Dreissena polymorpha]
MGNTSREQITPQQTTGFKMATSEQEAHQEVSSDMIGECIVINFCEPCTRKHTPSKATVFCKTCNEHLCGPCRNSHVIINRANMIRWLLRIWIRHQLL